MMLLDTPILDHFRDDIDRYLSQAGSIPGFLSSVTVIYVQGQFQSQSSQQSEELETDNAVPLLSGHSLQPLAPVEPEDVEDDEDEDDLQEEEEFDEDEDEVNQDEDEEEEEEEGESEEEEDDIYAGLDGQSNEPRADDDDDDDDVVMID
jgi:hypothetical protein